MGAPSQLPRPARTQCVSQASTPCRRCFWLRDSWRRDTRLGDWARRTGVSGDTSLRQTQQQPDYPSAHHIPSSFVDSQFTSSNSPRHPRSPRGTHSSTNARHGSPPARSMESVLGQRAMVRSSNMSTAQSARAKAGLPSAVPTIDGVYVASVFVADVKLGLPI
jgi:hypothetical protein